MKLFVTLALFLARAEAKQFSFEGFRERHNKILQNPHNQKLFATTAPGPDPFDVVTKPSNLRFGEETVSGEQFLLVVGYANPDCTGHKTLLQGLALDKCAAGFDVTGKEYSKIYRVTEDPFTVKKYVYYYRWCTELRGEVPSISNPLEDLVFDETYELGTCVDGMRAKVLPGPVNLNHGGITLTISHDAQHTDRNCHHLDEWIEMNFYFFDTCVEDFERPGGYVKYPYVDCTKYPSPFTKKLYSDALCTQDELIVFDDEEPQHCLFRYQDFDFSENDVVYYHYTNLLCNNLE